MRCQVERGTRLTIEAMPKLPARYLVEDVDRHGNVRLYVRPPGRGKVRIREKLGTPEFWKAYHAAIEEPAPAVPKRPAPVTPNSLRWLCIEYFESAEFKALAPRTRYVRKLLYEGIWAIATKDGRKWGDQPYLALEARHIRKARDAKAETPEAANGVLKALRKLFAWAIEVDLAKVNPAREVPYLNKATEGFHTWTVAEVLKYREFHPIGTKARLALELMLFTGTRKSDAVRLGPQMVRHGGERPMIIFTEAKGRTRKIKTREIPLLPELQAVLDATPSGHLNYLVTTFNKPFTPNGFGNWFRKQCDAAGLPHCTAHGLRKAGATFAAENGATEHQLMAIFGWESPQQAAIYTRKANRTRLASEAMHMVSPRTNGDEIVPLSTAVQAGGTITGKK